MVRERLGGRPLCRGHRERHGARIGADRGSPPRSFCEFLCGTAGSRLAHRLVSVQIADLDDPERFTDWYGSGSWTWWQWTSAVGDLAIGLPDGWDSTHRLQLVIQTAGLGPHGSPLLKQRRVFQRESTPGVLELPEFRLLGEDSAEATAPPPSRRRAIRGTVGVHRSIDASRLTLGIGRQRFPVTANGRWWGSCRAARRQQPVRVYFDGDERPFATRTLELPSIEDLDLLPIDLHDRRRVTLRAVDPDGNPLSGARWFPAVHEVGPRLATDRWGRLAWFTGIAEQDGWMTARGRRPKRVQIPIDGHETTVVLEPGLEVVVRWDVEQRASWPSEVYVEIEHQDPPWPRPVDRACQELWHPESPGWFRAQVPAAGNYRVQVVTKADGPPLHECDVVVPEEAESTTVWIR